MILLKLGMRNGAVKTLQLRLNTRLTPCPFLVPDGIFGPKTDQGVRAFQQQRGLVVDGLVGPNTWGALTRAPQPKPAPNVNKFLSQLGTVYDFYDHMRKLVQTEKTAAKVMEKLRDFFLTDTGARYLLVQRGGVGVIDFRHFYAACVESYNSGLSKGQFGVPLGGSEGKAVLLGLANEIGQCLDEATKLKLNSCFSQEDLGSNRLGAAFGALVRRREAENSQTPLHDLLRQYLADLQPLSPEQTHRIKLPGRWDLFVESMSAIFHGIGDSLVPPAY